MTLCAVLFDAASSTFRPALSLVCQCLREVILIEADFHDEIINVVHISSRRLLVGCWHNEDIVSISVKRL